MNNFSKYCNKWQLTGNTNKTKSMIFKQRNTKTEPNFIAYEEQAI